MTNKITEAHRNEIGRFNVFRLSEILDKDLPKVSFNKRTYYKMILVFGKSRLYFENETIEIEKQALAFFNPQIPYSWEPIGSQKGCFCVFTDSFFEHFEKLKNYPVFSQGGEHVYQLTDSEARYFKREFEKMFKEIETDYLYKYDVLLNLVNAIIHKAMKLKPLNFSSHRASNGSERICKLFLDLLERQFPIENTGQRLKLSFAGQYAERLNIHVNHLNRALKQVTNQSTKDLILERILKEAQLLLKDTHWDISQIGYCLGFDEASNFSTFFKKQTAMSPQNYRKQFVV